MRRNRIVATLIVMLGLGATMLAQAVTEADLAKLDTTATEIGRQVASLRTSDPTLAADVERTLTQLKEDVIYLRVRLRREGSVQRADFAEVRDRLETLRVKASGQKVTGQPVMTDDPMTGEAWIVPVGVQVWPSAWKVRAKNWQFCAVKPPSAANENERSLIRVARRLSCE